MTDKAKTWWLVSGPNVASSYFFKRKSMLHLNHEIPACTDNNSLMWILMTWDNIMIIPVFSVWYKTFQNTLIKVTFALSTSEIM